MVSGVQGCAAQMGHFFETRSLNMGHIFHKKSLNMDKQCPGMIAGWVNGGGDFNFLLFSKFCKTTKYHNSGVNTTGVILKCPRTPFEV